MEKVVVTGTFEGSRPPNRGRPDKDEMKIEELIARIKFKRTIRRMIKLIRS